VPGVILAAISPDNTPHGYNWTFAFPMLLFIVIALILYALFSRPHRRIPGRAISATPGGSRAPDAQSARAAAVAGGLSLAAGGGSTESANEPAGAHITGSEAGEPGGATMTGSVNPEDLGGSSQSADQSHDGTEASE
jgi:hypothetical protein